MIRIFTLCICLLPLSLAAQSSWQSIDPSIVYEQLQADPARPTTYQVFSHNLLAPSEGSFDLPMPDGTLARVILNPISNFHAELAQRYPSIRSYEIEHDGIKGRIDFSVHGLNGVYRVGNREVYLDALREQKLTLIYFLDEYEVDPTLRDTYTAHDHSFASTTDLTFLEEAPRTSPFSRSAEPIDLRRYDLALACTGEYAQKHGGTVEGALAAMNTGLNRINFILESELSINLSLIAENDSLIFLSSDLDPYTNGNAGTMANENNDYLAANLVSNKYDLGHVFGTDCGNIVGTSGGIGTVCGTNKGFGSSCELNNPNPDRFYIGVVCHELGHQFGAEHTWNSCPNAPDNQFNSGTAFEPGSGTTIMSYAGACGDQNIAFSEDFYFHNNSLIDITTFVSTGSGRSCAEVIASTNNPPEVEALHQSGFFIPIQTPFKLKAQGSDMDGDTVTFTWEQYNAGAGQAAQTPIQNPVGNGPIFRSVLPTLSPERILPDLEKILSDASDNTEVLPTYSRDLTFRVTARDNNSSGGAFAWDEVSFKVTGDAGPFFIPSLTETPQLAVGEAYLFQWESGGTELAPVNCRFVNIKMSLDDGLTFPILLAGPVRNDGEQLVVIPQVAATDQVRFMVEADDNIFFSIGQNSILKDAETPTIAWDVSDHNIQVCTPASATFDVQTFAVNGFADESEIIVTDVPDGVDVSGITTLVPGDTVALEARFSADVMQGMQTLQVGLVTGGDTTFRQVEFEAILNDFADMALISPLNGAANITTRPEFAWMASPFADQHRIEIATSPSFVDAIAVDDLSGTAFISDDLLQENTLYYWRVIPSNVCGVGLPSEIFAFHTISQVCETYAASDLPQNLSQSQEAQITSNIVVNQDGIISDVNINGLAGFHEAFGDLAVTLVSPAGTEVKLFADQCGFSSRQFSLGFDDESNLDFTCSTTFTGQLYRPQDSLTVFIGEGTSGDWTLIVDDSTAGSGGMITAWNLELCGSIAPEMPALTVNPLDVLVGGESVLDPFNLLASSSDLGPDRLLYTIVKAPSQGTLLNGSTALQSGDQFSQEMISSGAISYRHEVNDTVADALTFTVINQMGGWVPITTLPIQVSGTVSVKNEIPENDWMVYPNPARQSLSVEVEASWSPQLLRIFDLHGKLLLEKPWANGNQRTELSLQALSSGTYVIQMVTDSHVGTRKVVVL